MVVVVGGAVALLVNPGPDTHPGTEPPSPTPSATIVIPTRENAGTPAGWTPLETVDGGYRVSTPGAVVEDLRINGTLVVAAPNVTVRRVQVVGGVIDNSDGDGCYGGLVVEDTTIEKGDAHTLAVDPAAISPGGYTARRVKIEGLAEGFRVSGAETGCGQVVIEDSYADIRYPDTCEDWHGDAVQGYVGGPLVIRNSRLIMEESDTCTGTAALFYPGGQQNTSYDIDGVIVAGGGFPVRLGTPGRVKNLMIVEDSWGFGPIDVACSLVTEWEASIVRLDEAGQPIILRDQPCDTEG